jgi:hypothetical protein
MQTETFIEFDLSPTGACYVGTTDTDLLAPSACDARWAVILPSP